MNKLAEARKTREKGRAVGKVNQKELDEAKKKHIKGKFGDRAFDHMKAAKHDFRHPETCQEGHNPCSFCRIIQLQCDKMFKFEAETAFRARQESMIRRAEMRFKLLGGWSRNQGTYYDDLIPGAFKDCFMVDISISQKLVESLVEHAEFNEMIAGKEKLWGFGLELGKGSGTGGTGGTGGARDEGIAQAAGVIGPSSLGGASTADVGVLDLSEISKILSRRKRILEVGNYAATFLQARIRKMSARKRVRLYVLRRYEFVPSTNARNDFIIDRETNQIQEQPKIIEDVKLNTPRTMNRKFAAVDRVRSQRLAVFQKYISNFINKDTGDFYDLFAIEEQRMRSMRNFIVLRDVLATGFANLTRQIRDLRRSEKKGGAAEEEDYEEEDAAEKGEDDDGGSVATGSVDAGIALPSNSVGDDGGSVASIDSLGSLSLENTYEPMWLTLAAPAPPSRELGLTLALGKPFVQPKRAEGLNPLFVLLERRAWEALKCASPEDAVSKLMNENLHPPLQSCVHIADDDQNIWRGDSRIEPLDDKGESRRAPLPATAAAAAVPSAGTKSVVSAGSNEVNLGSASVASNATLSYPAENINKGHVLPVTIQLRPVARRVAPQNIFRLFFVEGELCGITAYSPWAFYPELFKDRELLLKTLQAFATTQEMRSFVHAYCNRANRSLLAANNFIDKNGLVDFDKPIEQGDEKVGGAVSLGNRRSSPAIEKQLRDEQLKNKQNPRCTQLYCPPQEFLFYNSKYLWSPKLTSEEVIRITKQYSFLKKMESWKPLLVKAQNEMFRNAGKTSEAHASASADGVAAVRAVQPVNTTRAGVLSDIPPSSDLLGTMMWNDYNMDVPESVGRSQAVKEKYFESLGSIALGTDCNILDRILKPQLKPIPPPPKLKIKGQISEAEEAERKMQAAESLKTEEERSFERMQQLKVHSLNLEMPPLNLMVIEVAAVDENAGNKSKKMSKKVATAPSPASAKKSVAGSKADAGGASITARKVNVKLHQVIGVFSCDRGVNDRPPPAIDCGLLEWEHICAMNDVAAYERPPGTHPLEWLLKPMNAGYFVPLEKSQRPWTHPNSAGVVNHVCQLRSKKRMIMSILGTPPDREQLLEDVPRNIRNYIGM
jgi:hypothetical protein